MRTKSLDKKYGYTFVLILLWFVLWDSRQQKPLGRYDNESFRKNWATKIQREKMYGPSLNHIGMVLPELNGPRTVHGSGPRAVVKPGKAYLLILMWIELVFVEKIYGLIRPVLFHFIIIHDQGWYDWLWRNKDFPDYVNCIKPRQFAAIYNSNIFHFQSSSRYDIAW